MGQLLESLASSVNTSYRDPEAAELEETVRDFMSELSKTLTDEKRSILTQCMKIGLFLADKNDQYGSSVFQPTRVFSRDLTHIEQVKVRIDDKLSRIATGLKDDEDAILDLIGYLIILRIIRGDQ